jgi:hypothetical protein
MNTDKILNSQKTYSRNPQVLENSPSRPRQKQKATAPSRSGP